MSLYCRVSHSLKERNEKLTRDSIEMDKVFRQEIKHHDKQSTSELVCSLNYTVKPACAVTSIKQSPLLNSHLQSSR